MRDDEFLHIRQIDLEVARVLQHGFRMAARIDENAPAVRLEQSRESSLTDTLSTADEHRGEYCQLNRMYLRRGMALRADRCRINE